ncbi:hypothetical protein IWW50_005232 [Coemansia erecta]|nr:hypothetical protein GGF43_003579 [Coemansia sp. RSA 2618]KAJ2820011.1 hypothetical protein IWW50_005232 [Coemansia erecta]
MPRSAINNTLIPLLRRLSGKLGEQQAKNELRWMAEHVRTVIGESGRSREHLEPSFKSARLWRDQPAPSVEEIERDNKRFSSVQWAWLRQAVSDRVDQNKPLQYILGSQPFGRSKIATRPPVLIPRWETEEWMLRLAELVNATRTEQRTPLRVLDACTGSGCIAIGLACELQAQSAHITGVDISTDAVALAADNLARNARALGNTVDFCQLDLQAQSILAELQARGPRWDMIVSNPPYVTPGDYAQLDPDVKDWEDIRALVPMPADADPQNVQMDTLDPSGLSFVVQLARLARDLGLADAAVSSSDTKVPRLVVEIGGEKQVEPARQAMHDCGFNLTEVWKDMAGADRVVLGYYKP